MPNHPSKIKETGFRNCNRKKSKRQHLRQIPRQILAVISSHSNCRNNRSRNYQNRRNSQTISKQNQKESENGKPKENQKRQNNHILN